jgi:hypothetical protein
MGSTVFITMTKHHHVLKSSIFEDLKYKPFVCIYENISQMGILYSFKLSLKLMFQNVEKCFSLICHTPHLQLNSLRNVLLGLGYVSNFAGSSSTYSLCGLIKKNESMFCQFVTLCILTIFYLFDPNHFTKEDIKNLHYSKLTVLLSFCLD